jgi:hypothetical protein
MYWQGGQEWKLPYEYCGETKGLLVLNGMPRRIWESTAIEFHHFSLGNGGRQGAHKSDTLKKDQR